MERGVPSMKPKSRLAWLGGAGPGRARVRSGVPEAPGLGLTLAGGGQTHMPPVLLHTPSNWLLPAEGWMCYECQVLTHLPQLFTLPLVSLVRTSPSCRKDVIVS